MHGSRLVPALMAFAIALPATAAEPLQAGFATIEITPPIGYPIAGNYYHNFSKGIHDPLMAKAMVLKQGSTKWALIVCDVCSMADLVSSPARWEIQADIGIPVANVVVSATHTHGGPDYDGTLRDLRHETFLRTMGEDPHEAIDYARFLRKQVIEVARTAHRNLTPVVASFGLGEQQGIAFNRRFHMRNGAVQFNPGKKNPDIVRPAGPVDTDLPFLLFRQHDLRKPVGSLTVFAMHVATFSQDSSFGADYPGVLARRLHEKFGEQFVSVFGQGTAGDINHIDVSTAQEQAGATEPVRIGNALADTLAATEPGLSPVESPQLLARSTIIHVPMVETPPEEVRAAYLLFDGDRGKRPFLDVVHAWKILQTKSLRDQFGDELPVEINVLRVSRDVAVVCLPHEIFVELGMAIKRQSPFQQTMVMSMAHRLDFYVPTRQAYAEGSYEVVTSSFRAGAGEMMVDAAVGLLKELGK